MRLANDDTKYMKVALGGGGGGGRSYIAMSGRSWGAIRPELKTFLTLYTWLDLEVTMM